MANSIDEEVARWKERGYAVDPGAVGALELVRPRAVSAGWLVFWVLLGVLPGAVYFFYCQLKSDERRRISVSEAGKLEVVRVASALNRAAPLAGALVLFPAGCLLLALAWSHARAAQVAEAAALRREAASAPVFELEGPPRFVPGTAARGPALKWEGRLVNRSQTDWPAAELVCRLKVRRGNGEVDDYESRSGLGGGKNSWSLTPAPTAEQPWGRGEARTFRCETSPERPVGIAQPESAALDVIVPLKGARVPWTTGALPVPPPAR